MRRPAIAMIELVIAIVVMAIALSGVPLMMQKANEGDAMAIRQEAIMLAATQMSNIATLAWDEEETNTTRNAGYAKFLDVLDNTGTIYNFQRSGGTDYRIGGVSMNLLKALDRRRFYHQIVFASTVLGPDAGETATDTTTFDDIDDFNGYSRTLGRSDATKFGVDYKFDYTVGVTVNYHANDIAVNTPPASTTNVKWVTVQVTGANDTNISLVAFMSNIGETKMLTKVLSW